MHRAEFQCLQPERGTITGASTRGKRRCHDYRSDGFAHDAPRCGRLRPPDTIGGVVMDSADTSAGGLVHGRGMRGR